MRGCWGLDEVSRRSRMQRVTNCRVSSGLKNSPWRVTLLIRQVNPRSWWPSCQGDGLALGPQFWTNILCNVEMDFTKVGMWTSPVLMSASTHHRGAKISTLISHRYLCRRVWCPCFYWHMISHYSGNTSVLISDITCFMHRSAHASFLGLVR
jgi:hypothetical protein